METVSLAEIAPEIALFALLVGGAILLPLLFWLWMLLECASAGTHSAGGKRIWLIMIAMLPVVGALVYFFIGRGHGKDPKRI